MSVNVPPTDDPGINFKVWCRKHRKPYLDRKANMAAAVKALTSMFLGKLTRSLPAGLGEVEERTIFDAKLEAASTAGPMCCQLTDDDLDVLLADMLPSTGDAKEDEAISLQAVPEMQLEEADCGNPNCPVHGHRGRKQ